MTQFNTEMAERARELLTRFKLPTCASEMIRRVTDAGQESALPVFLEVLEPTNGVSGALSGC